MSKKKAKQKVDWRIICTSLVCITALMMFALSLGFNGQLLNVVLVVIALVAGITIPTNIIEILKGGK